MGSSQTKDKTSPNDKVVEGLKYKVKFLQGEMKEIMCMREHESQAYEQEIIIFALKEAEWKKERKKLRMEVKKLKKKLEEKEEEDEENKTKGVENHDISSVKEDKECTQFWTNDLLEQIRDEQARRDEALEKWKQLYFAIKIELDDLIQRTNQGGGLCMKSEEVELLEELLRELKGKEETISFLKEQIASMEQHELRRERDVDILRQSLKIMSHNMKATRISKGLSKSLHM